MGTNVSTRGSALKPTVDRVGKEAGYAVFDAAAPALSTIAPTVPYDNASIVNCSECFIRVTVAPVDAATFDGDGTAIIPPYGSHDFGFEGENQIASIDLEVVDIPAAAGTGDAADFTPKAAIANGVDALAIVNFLEQ